MSTKTKTQRVLLYGGPQDGAVWTLPVPLATCIDFQGHAFDKVHEDGSRESGQFYYHYHLYVDGEKPIGSLDYRLKGFVYVFNHDWVKDWQRGGVPIGTGGDDVKKFGVGQILKEDDQALSKEATKEWSENDEQALSEENDD